MTSTAVTVQDARAPAQPSLIARMAQQYDMDPNKFAATIKETCIKGRASNEQFAAFLMVADKYGLNPLTKEIYAFPQDGGIVPIVGVDGWSRIINNHAQFNGMDFADRFNDGGDITAITCRMYRKDRDHPIEATEYMAECKRNTVPWTQWPARMLRHKVMIQAARYAFGYTGIVERDEYERQQERAAPRQSLRDRFRDAPALGAPQADDSVQPTPESRDEAPARDINADTETGEDVSADRASPQEGAVEHPDTGGSEPGYPASSDQDDDDDPAAGFPGDRTAPGREG